MTSLPHPPPPIERYPARTAEVSGLEVRRLIPRAGRRTIGAWCFLDHFGPTAGSGAAMAVGPHPHIGLQTVTWLLDGEIRHTDSLGSDQSIHPGQLNLMSAGHGISHAEESTGATELHGAQLWVAQPDATRHGDPAFEHHEDLPIAHVDDVAARVLMGTFAGARSPARTDTALVGVELSTAGGEASLPLDPSFEYGIAVLSGGLLVEGEATDPTSMLYLGTGRDALEIAADEPTVALLIGGEPFEADVFMWWNFVGRDAAEIEAAREAWEAGERFGTVRTGLDRIAAPPR